MQRFKLNATQRPSEGKGFDITSNTISGKMDEGCTKNENASPSCCLGYRHLVAFYCFVYFGLVNSHMSAISITIVAMVNHTQIPMAHVKNVTKLSCPLPELSPEDESSTRKLDGTFNWDSQTQGMILGLSAFGYLVANTFAGRLGEIFGAKRTLLINDLLLNICTIISPLAANWSEYALLVVQIGRGFFQGSIIPCLFIIMANWFPRRERGLLSGFAVCGSSFWACLAGLAIGKLCDIPSLGWPSAFYFVAGFNLTVTLTFVFLFHEVPKLHPLISKAELDFITGDQENDMSLKRPPAPWKAIFTSIPIHALNIGKFGFYWSISYFLFMHPTFMGRVLHLSMTDNGLFTAMFFILMTLGTIVSLTASYWLRIKHILGVNALRKGCSSLSALGCSLSLLGVRFAECNIKINMVCCSLALFFVGFGMCGTLIAGGDMSPKFSGSISGITSAVGSLGNTLVAVIVGLITKEETMDEWHSVFYMHIAVIGTCGIIFQVFGSADIQPFDSVTEEKPSTRPQSHSDSPARVHI